MAETKKTDILASLGLVKAPASLTCLGKVRVGEEGPRCQAGYLLTFFPNLYYNTPTDLDYCACYNTQ